MIKMHNIVCFPLKKYLKVSVLIWILNCQSPEGSDPDLHLKKKADPRPQHRFFPFFLFLFLLINNVSRAQKFQHTFYASEIFFSKFISLMQVYRSIENLQY